MEIKALLETARLAAMQGDLIGEARAMVRAAKFMEEVHDGMPEKVREASVVHTTAMREIAGRISHNPVGAWHEFRHQCVIYTHEVLLPWLNEEGVGVKKATTYS
jgi:hypothetical protein